ncbi:MAG: hypothetical protein R3F13_17250 [Prosthecobacter sp.]
MNSPSTLILTAWFIACTLSAQVAQPEPDTPTSPILTPAQTMNILKQLEEIEAKIGQGRSSIFNAALTKFRSAMGSEAAALSLYLDCYKLEHFERKDLKQTDFMDWRDRNLDRLKEGDFSKGLAMQLEYLVMTIQAQGYTKIEDMGSVVPALQAFIAKAVGAVQSSTKHTASGAVEVKDATKGRKGGGGGPPAPQLLGMLRQSVKGNDFSRAYQLDLHLLQKHWEYSPLNVGGIYEAVILPYYLAGKKDELPAQWDARINAELALEKAMLSETEYGIFYQEEYPRRLWEKNNYLVSNNVNALAAMADMLKIIRDNPSHPDAESWVRDFRKQVEAVSEPVPAPAPPETSISTQ